MRVLIKHLAGKLHVGIERVEEMESQLSHVILCEQYHMSQYVSFPPVMSVATERV